MAKAKIIYYAHPKETYGTYLENVIERLTREQFGEIYHIYRWFTLREAVNGDVYKKLGNIKERMEILIRKYGVEKIPEPKAKDVAHDLMKVLRQGITSKNILFNPRVFSSIFQGEIFKSKAYPSFCEGLIDCCDVVVTHGYPLDDYIRKLLVAWLNLPTFDEAVSEYCGEIFRLADKVRDMLWSPGTVTEIEYASENGKKVFLLEGISLRRVANEDINEVKHRVIPFDKHERYLYNKIWQPIAESIYRTLTMLEREITLRL